MVPYGFASIPHLLASFSYSSILAFNQDNIVLFGVFPVATYDNADTDKALAIKENKKNQVFMNEQM